ncbi:MAG: 6,7-dimethyl-8-ribityllumazine synthase [Candidatus Kerfeldbacteria bacterium]|nr:6,7-dimethyl-8-ribityllumazine synthase [Candidatus Kerfeldbacteria bacterium]
MHIEHTPESLPKIPGARVAILQAKWYREYVDRMVEKCVAVLRKANCPQPEHYLLPGSLELPLAAQTLIRNAKRGAPYDALVCFGAILKGETDHFEMIRDECIRGLGQVMLTENVPIIVEVLPVTSVKQLAARSRDDNLNKGIEAAIATAEIIAWRRKLSTKP